MKFPIKPIGDKVVIKLIEGEETTKSGLVVNIRNPKYRYGEVKAVGRGTVVEGTLLEPEVKIGDLVQITSRVGDEIAMDGETYHLVPERHILAVLDKTVASNKIIKNQVLSESSESNVTAGTNKQLINK